MEKQFIGIDRDVNKAVILRFVELLCNHLEKRFPDDELMDWQAFDHCIIANNSSFEFGKDSLNKLIRRFSWIIPNCQESVFSKIGEEYDDFKFLIAEKVKTGLIQAFTDVISCVMKTWKSCRLCWTFVGHFKHQVQTANVVLA